MMKNYNFRNLLKNLITVSEITENFRFLFFLYSLQNRILVLHNRKQNNYVKLMTIKFTANCCSTIIYP